MAEKKDVAGARLFLVPGDKDQVFEVTEAELSRFANDESLAIFRTKEAAEQAITDRAAARVEKKLRKQRAQAKVARQRADFRRKNKALGEALLDAEVKMARKHPRRKSEIEALTRQQLGLPKNLSEVVSKLRPEPTAPGPQT